MRIVGLVPRFVPKTRTLALPSVGTVTTGAATRPGTSGTPVTPEGKPCAETVWKADSVGPAYDTA